MSARASGNCDLNQASACSGSESLSNSAVGANNVHVKVLSYGTRRRWGRIVRQRSGMTPYMRDNIKTKMSAYFVRESNEHERMPGPNMKVIGVYREGGLPFGGICARHLQFQIFVRYVGLFEIHPIRRRWKKLNVLHVCIACAHIRAGLQEWANDEISRTERRASVAFELQSRSHLHRHRMKNQYAHHGR